MPANDLYHDTGKHALEKDGWTVSHDPLTLRWGRKDYFVDLGAERLLAATKANPGPPRRNLRLPKRRLPEKLDIPCRSAPGATNTKTASRRLKGELMSKTRCLFQRTFAVGSSRSRDLPGELALVSHEAVRRREL